MTPVYNAPQSNTSGREWLLAVPRMAWLAMKLGFDKNVPWETKSTLGLAMLYILSPIDGIPDFIPVVGQLEDLLIGLLVIDGIVNHIDRSVVLKHWTGRPEMLDSIGRFTSRVTRAMPDFVRNRVMKRAFPKGWQRTGEKTSAGPAGPANTSRKVVDAT